VQQIGERAGCSGPGMCSGPIKVSDTLEMQKLMHHLSDLNDQQGAVIDPGRGETEELSRPVDRGDPLRLRARQVITDPGGARARVGAWSGDGRCVGGVELSAALRTHGFRGGRVSAVAVHGDDRRPLRVG
jgi:hypothetical protein